MLKRSKTLLFTLISLFLVGCASTPPEPLPPEPLTDLLSSMKDNYWSCTNFFTADDVSLVLGTQPEHCKEIKTKRKTIGVIIKRDQADPVVSCVLPGSPAESGRLQRGALIWAIASEGVPTPDAALQALQRHMEEGKSLVISTNLGSVSVVPRRADARRCYWEIPGNVSTSMVEYSPQDETASMVSVHHSTEPGTSQVMGTFLNNWLVDIEWKYHKQ